MASQKGNTADIIVGGFFALLLGGTILGAGFGGALARHSTEIWLGIAAAVCLAIGAYMFMREQRNKQQQRFRHDSERLYQDMKQRRPHSRDATISTIRKHLAEEDDD